MKNALLILVYCLVCKERTIERIDVGVARGTVFQEVHPGAGSNNVDFVEETSTGLPAA